MTDPNPLFRRAEELFVARRYAETEMALADVRAAIGDHPAVLHLSALNWKALGNIAAARQAFEAAHRLAPEDPEIATNLGNLLTKIGAFEEALAAYDSAIASRGDFGPGRVNKAAALQQMGRLDDARDVLATLLREQPSNIAALLARGALEYDYPDLDAAADFYDAALARAPDNATALRGRAKVALDRVESDAALRNKKALEHAPQDMEIRLDLVRARDAEGDPRVLTLLSDIVARDRDVEATGLLCEMRWEHGDADTYLKPLDSYLAANPMDRAAWDRYAAIVAGTAGIAPAAEAYRRAYVGTGDPRYLEMEARFRSSAGQLAEADILFGGLPQAAAPIARARHALASRDPAAAERLLAGRLDIADKPDVPAWALMGLCWQLTGDDRFEWLHGQTGLVRVVDCGLGGAEIASFADRLRGLHRARAQPIGQSVRGGTQTRGNLFDRFDPEIRHMREMIIASLEDHRAALPHFDARHPLLRFRERPWVITGSWSIRLCAGGFHVSHIHSRGMLSSASYWHLPDPGASEGDRHAGWLELGGSPEDLDLPIRPARTIEPRLGQLVLFPATLHHGTRAFAQGERITAAFDVAAR